MTAYCETVDNECVSKILQYLSFAIGCLAKHYSIQVTTYLVDK